MAETDDPGEDKKEKKETRSGGVVSANTREGFRSETLACFALSAFGPAVGVETYNDHGVDLFCATAARDGQRLHVGDSYLVQVKSESVSDVEFSGPQAKSWLLGLGSPLLFCTVDKAATRVKLFSAWNLSSVLLQLVSEDQPCDKFRFTWGGDLTTDQPRPDAIALGIPIVDFTLAELSDASTRDRLRQCIEQWVEMDARNITLRKAGLMVARGYTKWETNKPPSEHAQWYKPFFYSDKSLASARTLIVDCATLVALASLPAEKEALAAYVKSYCDMSTVDQWSKDRLGIS